MHADGRPPEEIEHVLDTPDLANALESDRFKQFLDHLPIAIAVSELHPKERIVYGNLEFHRITGSSSETVAGQRWDVLSGAAADGTPLSRAIPEGTDFLGTFTIPQSDEQPLAVYAWSNIIEDDAGAPVFRLVALIAALSSNEEERQILETRIREKDMLLREVQHRVKNNLQMITALIRMEARHVSDMEDSERFGRLAGRVEALALLYQALSKENKIDEVDLGVYLSQIASASMQAQAIEGIRLNLKVDAWPVSINVAMPAGLVVNELITNALKYAFKGRDGGTITLQSLVDDVGCSVTISDDGVGLPPDVEWPEPGKLSALMVKALRENAHAQIKVDSQPGKGTTVTIRFTRSAASIA